MFCSTVWGGTRWATEVLMVSKETRPVRRTRAPSATMFAKSGRPTFSMASFVIVVFVRGLLRHGEHEIRHLDVRVVDGRVVDDDLGLRGAAARLRAVGLGLDGLLALGDGRLGEDDGGGDDALPAGA